MTIDEGYHETLARDDDALFTLAAGMRRFVGERKWRTYFVPRHLVSALVIKSAELLNAVDTADKTGPKMAGNRKVAEAVADVAMHVIRVADIAGVDIVSEVWRRLEANANQSSAGDLGPGWSPAGGQAAE
jgi:dCTP diphosphatase